MVYMRAHIMVQYSVNYNRNPLYRLHMLERLTNKRWFQHVDIRMEKRIESMLTFLSRHRGKKLLVDAIKFDD